MKAFEKWWENLKHITPSDKSKIKWGWEAALEWVRDEICGTRKAAEDVLMDIHRELEDK